MFNLHTIKRAATLLGFASLAGFAAITSSCVPAVSNDAVTADANLNFPVGRPDPQGRKHHYISPYSPYNIIVAKGYNSGELVGDPSTAKTDSKTGKIIKSTAKSFRLP